MINASNTAVPRGRWQTKDEYVSVYSPLKVCRPGPYKQATWCILPVWSVSSARPWSMCSLWRVVDQGQLTPRCLFGLFCCRRISDRIRTTKKCYWILYNNALSRDWNTKLRSLQKEVYGTWIICFNEFDMFVPSINRSRTWTSIRGRTFYIAFCFCILAMTSLTFSLF